MVDVLIAGAGPAGCVAGMALARAGVRVLLVDRAAFPRDKLCGDTLNPGALRVLERLGLDDAVERVSIPLGGMLLTGEGGVAVRTAFGPARAGRALTRRDLDALLVRAALAAGVQFQERACVRQPLVDEEGGRVRVRGAIVETAGGRPVKLPAALTIAADGRRSALAFGLGLARQPARGRRWAIGAYYDGIEGLGDVGEMHIRAGHYIGVAPLGNGRANVCLVSPAGPGFDRPEALLDARVRADPQLAARVAGARRASRVTVLGPLAVETYAAGLPGLLLAGDAAGFVDPMTGDGLRLAMRGAELAAEVVRAWFDDPSIDAPRLLAERRARVLGHKLRVNRLVRRLTASKAGVRAASAGARVAPGVLRSLVRFEADLRAEEPVARPPAPFEAARPVADADRLGRAL
jgi:geranylgeranyl reductase family protein